MTTLTKVVLATQLQLSSLHNFLVAIQTLIVLVAPVALIAPLIQRLLQYLEENDQNMVTMMDYRRTCLEYEEQFEIGGAGFESYVQGPSNYFSVVYVH